MADRSERKAVEKTVEMEFGKSGEGKAKGERKGFLGRFNSRFNEALESGRGTDRQREAAKRPAPTAQSVEDDIAMRRARPVTADRMVVPEGVIIEGSVSGVSDMEISGRVEGNITVEGRLHLGPKALVSGSVKASSCLVEGLVEGQVECIEEVELGTSGRLNADVVAGKRIMLAGQVFGNVTTPGTVSLAASAKVQGDLRARALDMDDGATLNGRCSMRASAQREKKP